MADDEQHARRALMSLDAANTARLRDIVSEIGWPTRSKVGELAEHRAWLLLQHADADRDFQRSCLELMHREPADEVCPQHIAYLEDRLAVADGRAQRFGTQLHPTFGGDLAPFAIDDPEHVDERRSEVGLPSLAEYLATATHARQAKPSHA